MRAEDSHRLPGLDEQGLVGLQGLQSVDDGIKTGPVARGFAGSAVDDELVGLLRHLRIEVIHEHPQRGFLRPAPTRNLRSPRCANSTTRHHSDLNR